jgi:hypothetical protein
MPGTIEMLLDGEYVPRAAVRIAATPTPATPPLPTPRPPHQTGGTPATQAANAPKAKTVASTPVTQAANIPKAKTVASTNPVQPTASRTLQSTSTGGGSSTTITRSPIPPAIPRKPQRTAPAVPAKAEASLKPVKAPPLPRQQRATQTERARPSALGATYRTHETDAPLKPGHAPGFATGKDLYPGNATQPRRRLFAELAAVRATTTPTTHATRGALFHGSIDHHTHKDDGSPKPGRTSPPAALPANRTRRTTDAITRLEAPAAPARQGTVARHAGGRIAKHPWNLLVQPVTLSHQKARISETALRAISQGALEDVEQINHFLGIGDPVGKLQESLAEHFTVRNEIWEHAAAKAQSARQRTQKQFEESTGREGDQSFGTVDDSSIGGPAREEAY